MKKNIFTYFLNKKKIKKNTIETKSIHLIIYKILLNHLKTTSEIKIYLLNFIILKLKFTTRVQISSYEIESYSESLLFVKRELY